jgi:ureidoglycolate hydrolase
MCLPLKNITSQDFAPYGEVIEPDQQSSAPFQIIIKEPEASGWQIAISKCTPQPISQLGLHPNTRESFEPMSGTVVIILAIKETPTKLEAFLLDKPVCLYKNIWHATTALSELSYIKITENCEVLSENYELEMPLAIGMWAGETS